MTLKKQSIVAILCAGVLFSCVPARKYEELKSKQTACFEENNTLKSQNQELEEKNKELFASTEKMRKEKEGMEHEIKVLEKSLDQMTKNYDNVNATYQLLLDKNNELLAGNKSATEQLMKQLQKTQEELQAQEDALRALEGTLQKKETTLNKLTEELQAREKRVNELESLISRQDSMVNALKNKVKEALLGFENNGLTIEQKNGKVYVSLDESLLFASGSYSVGERGIDALKKLAKVLEQNQEINVLVEGHTDNVPLKGSGDIKDNWDLSVKRATSVVKIITENSKTNPKRLTAAGRGEYFPLDLTNTPEGRKKNRRIEVILTPKLDELFELLETN
ncbi:MAG: cell envelope biogenesis protein OmpA [Bacteroidetes bacterium HGW-Bacteroidetes-12]|jgi:chemotaxis protein MotB|nr:MAG: cell envelope biogenesis protein OmpA [Bacteroidetes bacterium HGW-Bacteroidetes-12]